jgi:hypothetical protein
LYDGGDPAPPYNSTYHHHHHSDMAAVIAKKSNMMIGPMSRLYGRRTENDGCCLLLFANEKTRGFRRQSKNFWHCAA